MPDGVLQKRKAARRENRDVRHKRHIGDSKK